MTANPYAHYVDGLDVLASLEETAGCIDALVGGWTPAAFERSYAPGKWTARQLLIHLAHVEVIIIGLAGHDRHHLPQFEQIAAASRM